MRVLSQLGHQAANCPNGTINWRNIYGDEAFVMRQPVFYSDIAARLKMKEDGMKDLEQRAQAYAKVSGSWLSRQEPMHCEAHSGWGPAWAQRLCALLWAVGYTCESAGE